ncbi:MFS transporter [Lysinibacillus sp. CNPSo 3705]|uniref:MFS transporter n=1 Tax=Lysinibacillus sp. CNPSo 3705 TaxID=3028148 RepID=UPI00236405F2|nr:MFS transporter [Lysinibacillus sp. CNPSo 3705]MDD1505573.1 MFS transporter [Lysinibacillus sp. CNPSo 3705]
MESKGISLIPKKMVKHKDPINPNERLLLNRSFLFLWLSSTFSFLALSTYLFAEQWYIVRVLKQEAVLGIVLMVTMIPRIFLMTIGGVWADRIKRSRIMTFSSLIRCILVLIMLLFLQLSWLQIWPLICFAVLFGCVDAFFSPANSSLLPIVVSKNLLTRANSFIQSSNQIAMFSGPMIGGLIITISASFKVLFFIVAVFLFITFIFSSFIREKEPEATINNKHRTSTKLELKEGFKYVWNMPFLKNLIIILIIINFFFFGPLMIGIPLLVNNVLFGEAIDLSMLQGSYEIGMLVGAIFIGMLNVTKRKGLVILILISLLGIALATLGQINSVWQGVILLLIMGIFSSVINVLLISSIQEKSHEDKIGRVMSIVNASSNGLVPLSYAFVSLSLFINFSISHMMLFCGILIWIISILYIFKSKTIKVYN